MDKHDWVEGFPAAITVSDCDGIILVLNDRAVEGFQEDGGRKLLGTNMLDCHPEPARSQVADMMKTQRTNIYTTEKKGVKKLIYQSPWYENGKYAGFVEMALEIPFEMPHFIRG